MTEDDDIAAIERAEASRTMASMCRVMFNDFLKEGFSESQAMALVRSWMEGMARGAS